jgi:hypothetical protein
MVYDSGSNLNLVDRSWALRNGLQFDTQVTTAMHDSTGTQSGTFATVTSNIYFTVCRGTPHQCSIRIPLLVVDSPSSLYDVILGTQFITGIGSYVETTMGAPVMVYRPRWAKHQDNSVSHAIPIQAFVDNPTASYLRMLSLGTSISMLACG